MRVLCLVLLSKTSQIMDQWCSLAWRSRKWFWLRQCYKMPKMAGNGMGVVVGRGSAASETDASSSSLLEGRRRDSRAEVLFCDLLLRPSRVYTLWLSSGWRAAEGAEGRRGSELLRCCPQSVSRTDSAYLVFTEYHVKDTKPCYLIYSKIRESTPQRSESPGTLGKAS